MVGKDRIPMKKCIQSLLLLVVVAAATAGVASAQTQAPPGALAQAATTAPASAQAQTTTSGGSDDGWKVTLYPVFGWLPLGLGMNVDVPPIDGGGGTGGGVDLVDTRFDSIWGSAFSVSRGVLRVDADAIWAAVGGDRPDNPYVKADVDIIYGHGSVGLKIYKDLWVTGGVRRYALKYSIDYGSNPVRNFSDKPGLWDPLVGLSFHHVGNTVEFHATFDIGGFGVGADVDSATAARIDWKPLRHVGLTVGYNFLYYKASHSISSREFTFKQTVHGPMAGIGFYF
jgi:hypothetical protein